MGLLFLRNNIGLYIMAIHRSLGKIKTPLSHLPTWFFIIGYPLFWLELYTRSASHGVTSAFSWVLFAGIAFVIAGSDAAKRSFKEITASTAALRHGTAVEKWLWSIGIGITFLILAIVVLASLKPIHLVQESDCMQYHYTLPRQHLILGSFVHIPWAADDLFLLPMDFALSPFWFATALPNKIPQLIIFFGLISVVVRLTSALATPRRPWAGPLAVGVLLGTHGFGIQMGTGMLDLAVAYLFLASLDSLRLGHWFLAGVEFTFFFWSKSLTPIEVMVVIGVLFIVFALARLGHWQVRNTFVFKHWQRALALFIVLSLAVAGPFVAKSIYYTATPFFPLSPGMMGTGAQIEKHPQAWQSLGKASQYWMLYTKNSYGHGRDLLSFIKHWWLLAVPEKGVNNAFDYPLGLTYLLMIGPFLFFLITDILRRRYCPLSVLAVVAWGLWWFTTQQSRFLYLPLLIIFMVTLSRLEKISRVLLLCLLVSLSLEAVSLWGAHRNDINRWGVDVLRTQDKQLLELNNRYLGHSLSCYVDWPFHDVAYAQFPVMVHKESLPHTILY